MKCHLAVIVYGKLETKGIDSVVQICSRPIISSENRLPKILDFTSQSDTAFCFFTLIDFFYIDSGFPDSSDGKESACNAGDLGLVLGLGRFPREGHGNPLQY